MPVSAEALQQSKPSSQGHTRNEARPIGIYAEQ